MMTLAGTFPKAYSKVATSQGYFPSDNFPNVQFPKRQPRKSDNNGPRACFSRSTLPPKPPPLLRLPNLTFRLSSHFVIAHEDAFWEILRVKSSI